MLTTSQGSSGGGGGDFGDREVLGEDLVKKLADKVYDKRKQAAHEIEDRVRKARATGREEEVQRILACLKTQFLNPPAASTTSSSSNYKKGGLIGLASVAIGLEEHIDRFLPQLVQPVLKLFHDEEVRVRYYACETLFNISKVANRRVLNHFKEIFEGLCKLYADVDNEVRTGVAVLDRLMKDIVTQNPDMLCAENFVPLLAERAKFRNPFVRQMVLAWITLLLDIRDVDIVQYLPQYLEGLFSMIGDQSRDIRHNANACLNKLLKQLTDGVEEARMQIISDTASIIIKFCDAGGDPHHSHSRLTALIWVNEFVNLQTRVPRETSEPYQKKWIELLPMLVGGTLKCFDDQQDEIARMAVENNESLLAMAKSLGSATPVDQLIDTLKESMPGQGQTRGGSVVMRTVCFQWMSRLLGGSTDKNLRKKILSKFGDVIFATLLEDDDEVVAAALVVLALIMEGRRETERDLRDNEGDDLFDVVANRLLELFKQQTLEEKGLLMIRHLCGHLDARRLYVTVARAIQKDTSELEFAQQLVQTFSWILFTAKETKALREELLEPVPLFVAAASSAAGGGGGGGGGSGSAEQASSASAAPASSAPAGAASSAGMASGAAVAPPPARSLFLELLQPWFHNPVSALALCLWAQQYELASALISRLAAFEPSLDLLKQLDQLVHLLESPVFSRLRLQLLEPRRHPALLKCLLGLAMILPQAGAFNILRQRVQVVQSGLLLEAQCHETAEASEGQTGGREIANGAGAGSAITATGSAAAGGSAGASVSAGGAAAAVSGAMDAAAATAADADMATLLERFDKINETLWHG